MEPILAPLMTEVSLALCNFIGMMRKCVVNTATVNVEILAVVLTADS